MKIGLVIPTRGDRPDFIKVCKSLIHRQTVQPDEIVFVNFEGKPGVKDITLRYKRGLDELTKRGCDLAFLWEDDDWYSPVYIEWMIEEWKKANKPRLFGVGETFYYHLGQKKRLYMKHFERASAFNTMLRLPVQMESWPPDNYSFIDLHFWKNINGQTVRFVDLNKPFSIGIKHGVGMTGGGGHNRSFKLWETGLYEDWFKKAVGEDYDLFYASLREKCM